MCSSDLTAGPDLLLEMIDACRAAADLQKRNDGLSTIGGVHLYGPYFAAEKSGCHDRAACRAPESVEFERYFQSGLVRVATCAAELPGAVEFYRAARRRRCLVTCGHSNASWTEMRQAFRAGMRHVDHFWCAMSSVPSIRQRLGTPMQGSMAEFVLMEREMSTEVIADGCHLAPELLEFAYRMKGPDRLCLVTDCNRALDMPPGDYIFGHQQTGTPFSSDGKVGRANGGGLASAIVGMDHMVRQMHANTTAGLPASPGCRPTGNMQLWRRRSGPQSGSCGRAIQHGNSAPHGAARRCMRSSTHGTRMAQNRARWRQRLRKRRGLRPLARAISRK